MNQPEWTAKDFRFFHLQEVRYGDIDAQRHLNNACYFTFMEQARIHYLMALELWDGGDFERVGIILAEQKCTYLQPILFGQSIRVGVYISRMGNKSFTMDYIFLDAENDDPLALATSVQVTYDYQLQKSIAIPEKWRRAIEDYEAGS